ncbi:MULTISPECIES: urea ABC transporter permease subunit UrtB [unclassified Lentimonas]|uniref:urea ABC transporter permease subunit UrtB n=1 Tax=unclassified Lentimonas TaxID=2630993 RepID=UPI001322376F|nr:MULTISPECIES: urea ABC transporter permease subunit UrtB [unclassified Lentimonas]CAA6678963.1 Urea ABC transporter, permease protein UrtB [Lentimonas sp. CC4]CAA6685116.1 Urea ABC transporter, permease protein UrtB [Lentimonas sp. CC6]CAA7075158.1 Urea ABC transporter, permease protein UrtB [Lentimonas sp. CC4]CAA7168382.1 Urea ABC transporter, permease protein UrtB [Lentimonas sp. CC21]CAA7180003.1 Urea ABC transporter, permease protein UrtB [Lentimonas sp. CC8]
MGDYTAQEIYSIVVMQSFSGVSLLCIYVLMALGLYIIFGQMGVINMAHAEFLVLGSYTMCLFSQLVTDHMPFLTNYYIILAIPLSFGIAFFVGYMVEWLLISRLYKRPLDTLLATWGLSLLMQQCFRTFIGARETSATLPEWLLGSWSASDTIDIPISGLVLLVLTAALTIGLVIYTKKTRMGLRMRATTQNREMTGALGINTKMTDRVTFGIACGISGIAGAFFTTMASTSPSAGTNYIVDSFLVLVVGGLGSLFGLFISGAFLALLSSILEFFMTGSIAKVFLYLVIFIVLMKFPRGLFSSKVRT